MFDSREQAGELLADRLKKFGKKCQVIAIPRGGVVIGAEIAKKLSCSLDVIIIRKLGAPSNPELAIGATTSKGGLVLDRELIDKLKISKEYVHQEHLEQLEEAKRRERVYLPAVRQGTNGKAPDLVGKTALLVDDGIATGSTVEAAVQAVREELPGKIVIAVPVAPSQTVERLKKEVDELIVLSAPESFWAIGEFYSSFPQVSDEEVIELLQEHQKPN